MNTASKLAVLCALALAAIATASASALAQTTITPTGAWTATEDGPGTLTNSVLTITCTASTATGTVDNNATPSQMTIDTLTLDSCQNAAGGACTATVDTLPAQLDVNLMATAAGTAGTQATPTTPPTSGATQTAAATQVAATESATITCGGTVTCTASTDSTLMLEGFNTIGAAPATLRVVDQPVGLTTACGIVATWNSAWTINQTSGQQTGATPATVTYTGATLEIEA